jgi:hypothetical protein
VEENKNSVLFDAPKPALFNLDLGANGGIFAPTSIEEMRDWVQREYEFWSWTHSVGAGNHKGALDQAIHSLNGAFAAVRDAITFASKENSSSRVTESAAQVQSHVREAFLNRKLPHSTSPLGRRVEALKIDPLCAIAYVYPFLQTMPGNNYQFDGRDLSSWHGFTMGLIERFNLVTDVEPAIQVEREALTNLRSRAEVILNEKKESVERLHREFVDRANDISDAKDFQQSNFDGMMAANKTALDTALQKHVSDMETLRRVFREDMTLRGPVEYWKTKAINHESKSSLLMRWMFGSMAGLAVVLGGIAAWVFLTLTDGKPDAWKVTVLVLVGVLGVWAVRLVVRMFLSHTHLATDAEERVTMVMTYLALLEGEKMPNDEDRKLVLAPLFRPASDGMVKDEGLPHPMLELFTRASQR